MTLDSAPILSNDARSDWVRLQTLLALRWLAVAGQIAAVLVSYFIFDVELRVDLCLFVILLSVAFNLVAVLVLPETKRLSEASTTLPLFFDLTQLGALLYLTGGVTNPFVILIIAPVIISATALTLRATLFLGAVAVVLTSVLTQVYLPLTLAGGVELDLPVIYIFGMWLAILIAVIFLGAYARRVTVESFSMSQALVATQLALSRELRLSALGWVVAAAAHELGTPLATIKLASSELADELKDLDVDPQLVEDAQLICAQTDRCREILRDMGRAGKDDNHLRFAPISAVIAEAAEPHQDRGRRLIVRIDGEVDGAGDADQPVLTRRPEIIHGLRNLIQNAVDFATSTVWIDVDWDETILRIAVSDDGPGYPAGSIGRRGDPFLRRRSGGTAPRRPGYEGMGLGLFIAKTLLERAGCRLTFANGRNSPAGSAPPVELARGSGAVVECVWDRASVELDRETLRRPLGSNMPQTLKDY